MTGVWRAYCAARRGGCEQGFTRGANFFRLPPATPTTGLTARAGFAVMALWGFCDPPMRRHAQVSRPVSSHEGAFMSSHTSISQDKLARLIGTAKAPVLIDVRTEEDFAADPRLIPGAVRRSHQDAADWSREYSGGAAIVVCMRGAKLAQGTAAWLRHADVSAETLEDGFEGWKAAKLPLVPAAKLPTRDAQGRTVWVTRARPKIDSIACPWLIRRFIDPRAVFLFVAPAEVEGVAERFAAVPFDIENVFFSHRGEGCTFDVMIEEFDLSTEPLRTLAA